MRCASSNGKVCAPDRMNEQKNQENQAVDETVRPIALDGSDRTDVAANRSDETLSDRVQQALGNRNPHWLATATGLPYTLVRKYLTGSVPGADKAVKLADALGVSLEWLLAGRGSMTPRLPAGAPSAGRGPQPIEMDWQLLEDAYEQAKLSLERGNELRAARGAPPVKITDRSLAKVAAEIYEQSYNAWVEDEQARAQSDERRKAIVRPVASGK